MGTLTPSFLDRVARVGVTALGMIPTPVQRALNRTPVSIDGQTLHPEVQLALKALSRVAGPTFEQLPVDEGRRQIELEAWQFAGRTVEVGAVRDLAIPTEHGAIPARLYRPPGVEGPRPLLVYFHGGGWVLGSIDSHDNLCRFLCAQAEVAVLNVGYRLAPEHPFPAAVEDAMAAFDHAVTQGEELGGVTRVAVGGDSAGGNLAAVVAQQTRLLGRPQPAFQLLFAPVTDLSRKAASYELFGEGFFLTAAQMDWYRDHYLAAAEDATDPRVSPLLADDVSGVAPAYIAVGGFDPLRDEGEAYARRLADAGVPVALRRHANHIHAFANAIGVGRTSRTAMVEAAGALRVGLAG